MKSIKLILLGVVLTLSALFVFLNQTEIVINFLFVEVHTSVSTAITVAFFLGLFTGVLLMLMRKSKPKEIKKEAPKEDVKVLPKNSEDTTHPDDVIHGIPLDKK